MTKMVCMAPAATRTSSAADERGKPGRDRQDPRAPGCRRDRDGRCRGHGPSDRNAPDDWSGRGSRVRPCSRSDAPHARDARSRSGRGSRSGAASEADDRPAAHAADEPHARDGLHAADAPRSRDELPLPAAARVRHAAQTPPAARAADDRAAVPPLRPRPLLLLRNHRVPGHDRDGGRRRPRKRSRPGPAPRCAGWWCRSTSRSPRSGRPRRATPG